jgi:hypothetical protein
VEATLHAKQGKMAKVIEEGSDSPDAQNALNVPEVDNLSNGVNF